MAFHALESPCVFSRVCRFLLQNVFLKLINLFVFFLLSQKIFCERKVSAPAWTLGKCYCGNKTAIPSIAPFCPLG